eukprot:gene11879-biopygen1156
MPSVMRSYPLSAELLRFQALPLGGGVTAAVIRDDGGGCGPR